MHSGEGIIFYTTLFFKDAHDGDLDVLGVCDGLMVRFYESIDRQQQSENILRE